MKAKPAFLIPLVLLFTLGRAAAQEASDDDQKKFPEQKVEIVVTADRLETPLKETSSSITVLKGEDLRKTGKTTVVEAMQAVLGTTVIQSGGQGETASVMLRGANSEHTLVLIDGLEMNDPVNPSRSCDLSHLSLVDVERIEILRGPQSTLYGSDALGGVINIITRRGGGKPGLDLSVSGGSLGTADVSARFSGSAGRLDYALSASHDRTSGISAASSRYAGNTERDGWNDTTAAARFGLKLSDRTSVSLNLRGSASGVDLDNYGGPYGDDPNSRQTYRSGLARLGLETWTVKGVWRQTVSLSLSGSGRNLNNPTDDSHPDESETAAYHGGLLKLDWQNDLFLSRKLILTAGVEHQRERADSDYIYTYDGYVSESAFPDVHASLTGVYLQGRLNEGDGFFLTAGARVDSHSLAGSAVTFRITPVYIIKATGTRFKAALGTGFKAPSLYQLYAPATSWGPIGNADLSPERLTGWEAGAEQPFLGGRFSAGLTYFNDRFRNLIDFDTVEGYINVGRARTSGLEAAITGDLGGGFKSVLTYATLRTKDLDTGETLLRRPRSKFSAELSGRLFGRLDFAASCIAVGRRYDTEYAAYPYTRVELPPYALLNAYLSMPVHGRWAVFLKLDNLTNKVYESVWGYGTEGRTAQLGFRTSI